jgi:DHA1 family tetracycline resistance protein-like MFS transporter
MQKNNLPVLFLTLLIDMIGIGMIIPIIPIIFTDPSSSHFLLSGYSTGAQYIVAGAVTALFGLMQFIAAPILGELSDVFGRKRLLTIGVGILALSQILFGFGIEIASLSLILISRAIAGIAGANISIAQASIADVTEPKDRAKNFGLIGAAFGIGFIVGPILGAFIASATGNPAAPFWVAGALGVLNVMSISLFLPETHHNRSERKTFTIFKGIHNIQAAIRDVDARPLYLASFLYVSGFAFFTSFVGIMLVSRFHFSETGIGTFFAIMGIWIVFTQAFILRILTKKFSERTIVRSSLLCMMIGLVLYAFVPSVFLLYLLVPVVAVSNGLTMANIGALVSKSVSATKQGAALGINSSLMALSTGIIPLLAGFGSDFVGIRGPFLAGAFFVAIAWSVLFLKKSPEIRV